MSLLNRLRRDRPPAEVLSDLPHDDRLVSWATAAEGTVVATRRGLRLPGGRVLPWHRIDKAVWRDGVLAVTEAVDVSPDVMEARSPIMLRLTEPRDLPAKVRTRVTQSISYSSHHPLPGGRGVRVVARRIPGQDGLHWSLRYDAGTDQDDDSVRTAAAELLEQVRTDATAPE